MGYALSLNQCVPEENIHNLVDLARVSGLGKITVCAKRIEYASYRQEKTQSEGLQPIKAVPEKTMKGRAIFNSIE